MMFGLDEVAAAAPRARVVSALSACTSMVTGYGGDVEKSRRLEVLEIFEGSLSRSTEVGFGK